MKRVPLSLTLLMAAVVGVGSWVAFSHPSPPQLYTSTSCITDLAWQGDTLWVATRGGVLRWRLGDQRARKFTMLEGLPDNEVRCLTIAPDGGVFVATLAVVSEFSGEQFQTVHRFDGEEVHCLQAERDSLWIGTNRNLYQRAAGVLTQRYEGDIEALSSSNSRLIAVAGQQWLDITNETIDTHPLPGNFGRVVTLAGDGEKVYASSTEGLWRLDRHSWKPVSTPAEERGSHVSAIAHWQQAILCAFFAGDWWQCEGDSLRSPDRMPAFPRKDVTTIAADGDRMAVGTLGGGVFVADMSEGAKGWRHVEPPPEPTGHNVYAAEEFGGRMWFSTFEHGLMTFGRNAWTQPTDNAARAPRQMTVFQDRLYVRQTDGSVSAFDGNTWKPKVWSFLPRKWTSTIASDGNRLYVGVWGGWSECDGATWTHHLKHPQLTGQVITCIAPDGDDLWLGTQTRGVLHFNRRTQTFQVFDQRSGLQDDWITGIVVGNGTALIGTFNGGAAEIAKGIVTPIPDLPRAVTALESVGHDRWLIATREGLFTWNSEAATPVARVCPGEVQCLSVQGRECWVGARTGLWRLSVAGQHSPATG